MEAADLVATLQRRIDEMLTPLLDRVKRVALLDFPSYANVGDSAIWLGTVAYLHSRGIHVAYTADRHTFDASHLRARLGQGVVLLTGGGNLGDVWEAYQQFREQVIATLSSHRIIQLPQSIWFNDVANLHRARRCFDRHADLTIMVRDQASLELAANTFRSTTILCPDLAFWLGPLRRLATPTRQVVRLIRQDRESARDGSPGPPGVDWTVEPRDVTRRLHDLLSGTLRRYPRRARVLRGPLSAMYGRMARQRLHDGVRLLSSGEIAITDRLHGHILCLLLGIRHFVVADRYGKLERFRATWTAESSLATWCASAEVAEQLADRWTGHATGVGT